ncbi:MAG TPA: 1-deoxy-D-xylulose-5-phosphate reductoisomerase [Xylella taiwanensis]
MTKPIHNVAVLGATGSIGAAALDVITRHPRRLHASLLAAGRRVDTLLTLCRTHRPDHAVIGDLTLYPTLRDGLNTAGLATKAHAGEAALAALVASAACDTVVAGIVGAAGLSSTLAAARAGKRLLLANKESLVLAGMLLMRESSISGAEIIPIDSEHNAIFQCLRSRTTDGVRRVFLTASGGPFRGHNRTMLANITPTQAMAHPKWSMGPKISVDSATLMNKGLEVIEAHHLFGLSIEHIEVLVHPQSLVHSLVEFVDGSTLAQLSLPDMRTTLAVGLFWPERIDSGVSGLDLLTHNRLDFERPDTETFPCLRLARDAMRTGGTAPAVLNAANEVAVSAFLQGRIGFLTIPALIEHALATLPRYDADTLETLLTVDTETRRITHAALAQHPLPV